MLNKENITTFSKEDRVELSAAYLKYKCIEGFKKRRLDKKLNKKEYVDRLKHEIKVIIDLTYQDYFLIVSDYVNWARSQGIRVGPGRGSGAGSIVGWLLGITQIDPIKYGLYFERFLNKDRVSPPDYDVDFQDNRRSEVFDYIKNKYGQDCVAAISTHDKLKAKAAIKDVARSLRIGKDTSSTFIIANKITSAIPTEDKMTIKDALEQSKELVAYKKQFPQLFDIAQQIEGLIRQSGTHAAGIIISNQPLRSQIPLKIHKRKKDAEYIITTEYDGQTLEDAGYLKVDLLGLRTLSIIDDTIKNIKNVYKRELTRIPENDKKTFHLLNIGYTMNVFQLESLGMRTFLKRVNVESIEDIAIVLALHRPGPLETFAHEYADRRHGKKPTPSVHFKLDEILKSTHGVIIYQEQVIRIANELAGFTLSQADVMRRAIGKKKKKEMIAQKERFIEGCEAGGVSKKIATELFTTIEAFAKYSFNMSHSISYATIAYQTAYLKANFPTAFMASVLTHEDISSNMGAYMRECERLGISVLSPNVNESDVIFKIKDKQSILWDLASFKHVGKAAVKELMENRPFVSFEQIAELDARRLNSRALNTLNNVGAFDTLMTKAGTLVKRSQIEASIKDIRNEIKKFKKKDQVVPKEPWFDYPDIAEWDDKEILIREIEVSSYPYLSRDPYKVFKDQLPKHIDNLEDIQRDRGHYPPNKRVTLVAYIETKEREMKIKKGKQAGKTAALFIISDKTDAMEMIAWPAQYEKYNKYLKEKKLMCLHCTITKRRQDDSFLQLTLNGITKIYI